MFPGQPASSYLEAHDDPWKEIQLLITKSRMKSAISNSETFGIWSPFALRTLHLFADRTTTRSGAASTKVARRNLLQQLSVSLWTSNARMVLRYSRDTQGLCKVEIMIIQRLQHMLLSDLQCWSL